MVQTMMVSMNGPSMATKPWRAISLSLAAVWAMGADPSPDSLLNTPRATPFWMVHLSTKPKNPAPAAKGVNA